MKIGNISTIKKFTLLFFLFFLITLNYHILKILKDTLVITSSSLNVKIIPYLKIMLVPPITIIAMTVFSRSLNRFKKENIFYSIVIAFLLYFLIFTINLSYYKNLWNSILFYLTSELWGILLLAVAFWGIVNELYTHQEAKKYYGFFSIAMNFALILAGQIVVFFSKRSHSLISLMFIVITICCSILIIFTKLIHYFETKPMSNLQNQTESTTLSFVNSLKHFIKSHYLICLGIIVFSYNMAVVLIDIVWKNYVFQRFPRFDDFNAFTGNITSIVGVLSIVVFLFSGFIIKYCRWSVAALITPYALLLVNLSLFICLRQYNYLVILLGIMHNCIATTFKYSFVDPTKELALVAITTESKRKGKIIIDGICSKLGKAMGALFYIFLFSIFPTIDDLYSYVIVSFVIVIGIWTLAIRIPSKKLDNTRGFTESKTVTPNVENIR
jgi:ATP:ADP antiporter, AAA family